ncbi:PREDICTED: GRIP and coiled-coil domain-containing protein 2-like [Amphimedon queenslandica]|uniref:Death domain-containing protein n=1 Tax=Amphimedon queenslandica TaxID=400682 RepID=A0AAN0JSE6_AMPQE|nr:PREDICTED: GRIP and coiled-coil domain-containing protein 2-like [Amphimedon queenslandica]|eukprot:XP_019859741.1 PREDICTED: GRIP and coiled-coil domain-containing protein 2-like [Amphimedon queenslandica]
MATKTSSCSSSLSLFSSPLTIEQLIDVLNLLKRCGFPQRRWKELGLTLGLLMDSLDAIAENYSKVEDRFIECIARWLRRADNVDSKGGATFDSLSDALKSMNENAAAENLDQENQSFNDDKKLIKVFIPDNDMSTDTLSTGTTAPSLTPPNTPTVEIAIPKCMSHEFTSIQTSYGRMLYNVHKIIKNKPPPLDDVKEFLRCCKKGLESKLSLCSNITEILRVVEKECSLINVRLLQSLVEEFGIKKAEKYITEYNSILKEFCRTVKISLCLNEKFEALGGSPSLQCETVTYVFDWEPDEHMLQDIEQIISKTSGKLNGLMKLTVGYCTIWKKQKIPCEIKEQPHDTKRQKELKKTAQQLTNILSEKEKELNKIKEKIQEMSSQNETKEDQNEEECTLVEIKEVKEATSDLEEKLQGMKKEYHIKCHTDSTSASYKIIKGMRMEIEQILKNKTGLLDQNESLIDIKGEGLLDQNESLIDIKGEGLLDQNESSIDIKREGLLDQNESLIDIKGEGLLDQNESSIDIKREGLLDQNESLIDIKGEIAELQEQISLMSVHILNKREENEGLMYKIKDYKRDTLKLNQKISSEQTLDKREEGQQAFHREIKEQLDRLIINVETVEPHKTKFVFQISEHYSFDEMRGKFGTFYFRVT